MSLPENRREPTDCKGGWFYVNDGSITVVAYDPPNATLQVRLTRLQLKAAIKLMRSPAQRLSPTSPSADHPDSALCDESSAGTGRHSTQAQKEAKS